MNGARCMVMFSSLPFTGNWCCTLYGAVFPAQATGVRCMLYGDVFPAQATGWSLLLRGVWVRSTHPGFSPSLLPVRAGMGAECCV